MCFGLLFGRYPSINSGDELDFSVEFPYFPETVDDAGYELRISWLSLSKLKRIFLARAFLFRVFRNKETYADPSEILALEWKEIKSKKTLW